MSATLGFLFIVTPVVAIAYVVWTYRKRAAEKELRSRERLAALVGLPQGVADAVRKPTAAAAAAVPPAVDAAPAIARSEPFLTQRENLLYYLLKAGLPGHEVFAHVSVASVLGASAQPLPRHDLSFIVCDKSMRVVAAVLIDGTLGAAAAAVSRSLTAAGIRLVQVDPANLPRRDQVQVLIYGQKGASQGPAA